MGLTKLQDILNKLLVAAAVFFILLFAYVSLSRIGYPFELEWMEGGSVEHLERVIEGKPIYTPPSIEFIPYIYTPLYYYVSVPVAKLTGVNLLPLRIVSLVSTFLLFALIFVYIRMETGSSFYGIIAAGLFAATFRIGGAWFDIARVDMLFLLLVMAAVYFLRFGTNRRQILYAAFFASLAFLTKQTAALIFLPIGIYLLFRKRKLSWYFNITFAVVVILTTVYYTLSTDGWYFFWNFTLPADHRWNNKFLILFWTYDLIKPFAISILLGIIFLAFLRKSKRINCQFYSSFIVGMFLTAWLSRLHYGGYTNVLMPAYLILVLLAVLGFSRLNTDFENTASKKYVVLIAGLALLFQFTTLLYSPRNQIPTKADEQAGWELVGKIKSIEGDVYIPGNIYLARLAGKKVYTHGLLIWDLMQSKTKYAPLIKKEFDRALKEHKFALIIDYTQMNYPPLYKYYEKKGPAFKGSKLFWMRTGFTTRPENIFIPKK